jgi:predicted nucleic acid-binding protein
VVKSLFVDASPLIFLTQAGQLDLLQQIAADMDVIIPVAVDTEIQQYGEKDVTVLALAQTNWLVVDNTPPVPKIIQSYHLGAGESAVLTGAHVNQNAEAIIDDLAARRCATALEIPVRGTLGLVLTAKQRGIIPAAKPIIEHLHQAGMYLSGNVINKALALVGE